MNKLNDMDMKLRNIWQIETKSALDVSADDIRDEAAKFGRKIKSRNMLEYVAGFIALACFTWYILILDSPWLKIGSALTLMGLVFVMVNLHFRASHRSVDQTGDCRSYFICELKRHRDALKSVWLWYILPLMPGFVVFRIEMHLSITSAEQFWHIIYDVSAIALFAFIIWLNGRAAKQIQLQIDEAEAQNELSP